VITITHPEKVLFPDDGITKGELAAYYEAIAPIMLPHLTGRPVTMERFHRGIGEEGFFQKSVPKGPEWLERVEVPKEGRHGPPSARERREIAPVARQPELHNATRLGFASPAPAVPGCVRVRPRPDAR
jgi:DNA primase